MPNPSKPSTKPVLSKGFLGGKKRQGDDFLKNALYVIDVSHMLFRAYHALPPLTRADDTPVGALYGFVSMLFKLVSTHAPVRLVAVFDSKGPSFRKQLFEDYKANRPPPPPDLSVQFTLAQEACAALGVPHLKQDGVEADDIMATLATQEEQANSATVLVSSDKDLMQLVNDHTVMFDAMKDKWIDTPDVREKFGVPPEAVVQVQALMGDTSDNIPGVPGIGPKTAATLIAAHGDLETLYDNLDTLKSKRQQQLLATHKDQAFVSRDLAMLKTDLTLDATDPTYVFEALNSATGLAFLEAQGFNTLAGRLKRSHAAHAPSRTLPVKLLNTTAELETWLTQAFHHGRVTLAVDETTERVALYVPGKEAALWTGETSAHHATLTTLLENSALTVITDHLPPLLRRLPFCTPQSCEDVQLATFLCEGPLRDNTASPRVRCAPKDLGALPSFVTHDKTSLDEDAVALLEDAAALNKLWHHLKAKLIDAGLFALYQTLDKPLAQVLCAMEHTGIAIDPEALNMLGAELEARAGDLKARIIAHAGEDFNPASPKQLSHVLFEHMNLSPGGKKGKSGSFSTDSEVLENLDHPIAADILHFRSVTKLKNTYVDGLLRARSPDDGRIHTTFLMTGTSTGRLASKNPNLQNIPIRDADGQKVRQAFCPQEGWHFLSLDYDQIELKLLAHMGDVAPLKEAFRAQEDIHRRTASEMFEVPLEQVSAEQRRSAKMINFGIIYGISAFGLAKRLHVPHEKAAAYIKRYKERYQGVVTYMEHCIETARHQGFVTTLWERRLYVPDIRTKNPARRAAAERLAINAPLQGTSADIIKKAMIGIHALLQNTPVRLLLQIHDELLFEGPREVLEQLTPQLTRLMEQAAWLDIPLTVSATLGTRWGEVA